MRRTYPNFSVDSHSAGSLVLHVHPWAVEEVITLSLVIGSEELISGDFVVTVGVELHEELADIISVILGHMVPIFVGEESDKVLKLGFFDSIVIILIDLTHDELHGFLGIRTSCWSVAFLEESIGWLAKSVALLLAEEVMLSGFGGAEHGCEDD